MQTILEKYKARLYPCPFCGSVRIEVVGSTAGVHSELLVGDKGYRRVIIIEVLCHDCNGRGGKVEEEHTTSEAAIEDMVLEAIRLWNTRTQYT